MGQRVVGTFDHVDAFTRLCQTLLSVHGVLPDPAHHPPMPDNSSWSAEDPDATASDPSLHFDPEDVSEDGVDEAVLAAEPSTAMVISEASSSPNDSDWLGDEDYDHDGNLIPGKKPLPSRLLRPSTNRRLARAYERRRKVVEMRIQGHTYPEIARALKFNSVDGARDAFNRAMLDTRDVAEEYRDLELARLEAITQVLWPMIESGDLEAIDKYMKIVSARVKITRMDQLSTTLSGHGVIEGDGDNMERIGMVEDVQQFLAMIPEIVKMTNQPAPMVINQDGEFVGREAEGEEQG